MLSNLPGAYIPTPFRVLGLDLKPLCLGHLIILNHGGVFENAFNESFNLFQEFYQLDVEQFYFAVFVCSKSYEDSVDALINNDQEWLESWVKATEKMERGKAHALFFQYLSEGFYMPAFERVDRKGLVSVSGNWFLAMKRAIMSNYHLSESEFLNAYLPKLTLDYLECIENVRLITDEEMEIYKEVNQDGKIRSNGGS